MRPPRTQGIVEACLYVDDLEAAERFYRDVLGLEMTASEPQRHRFFRVGSQMLLVFNPQATAQPHPGSLPPHGTTGPGHLALAMATDEIAAWKESLQRAGVPIEAEIQWGDRGRSLYFRDPAGNSLELVTPSIWQ
jgi:catechol 2,3-dioxygenase-like lactoylglutathione lyase family enzyme